MSQTVEFDELISDVAAGSEEAVWRLAETYTPHIIRAVRATLPISLRSKLDSEDFVQSLWKSLLLKPSNLTALKTPERLIAYLAGATRNKVIDKTRHFCSQKNDVRREERLPDSSSRADKRNARVQEGYVYSREPAPSTTAALRERWKQLLSNSSERDRAILRMRMQGCTFAVISEKLQIDKATARRAIQRLIQQFSE